ncbi:uncharacterized protein LOC126896512 isoform X6 [Daktulosphaira vitifoliae]|uniref:uncharacterized protein LOC126896512 isoform X5 n=1 Tax=Daktulosphaira vitifoliae TaxID=58002 RepID=UPI0021AA4DD8|nr:uncharacterized protein LOC126896512 isoform X5 [Daktulosphaira vitifoliae]XP_050525341.1 uncharacterized protein LOC126896512 isoform X6 [Daktulosphaira vitifoliae]
MKNLYTILILFIIILFTETKFNSKFNTNIFNSLIKNDGWRDLKDVTCVQYLHNSYYLDQFLVKAYPINCNKQIRLLTIFLACSYLSDLKTLFFIFVKFGEHCKSLIKKRSPISAGYICAIELLKIIQKVPSLATLMKETLYVLDYLHTESWKVEKNNTFVLEILLLNLENFIKELQNNLFMKNESSICKKFLRYIIYFFNNRDTDTEWECNKYCTFVSCGNERLWHEWNEEYKHKINNDKTMPFYDYLSQKVNLLINSIIIKKFHKLGFQYDRNFLQIGIPIPKESTVYDFELFTRPNITFETSLSGSQRKGIKNQFENRWILEFIDSFNKEFNNVSQTNKEIQLIDFLGKDLVNVPEANNEMQLIDFLGKDLVNVPEANKEIQLIDFLGKVNKEIQLIDFLGKGLNSDNSYEDLLEPMETDENRKNFTKYL